MQIFLARTQGFCGGVARAIDTVEQALAAYGTPLYVHHEIVHNTAVVNDLKARGVTFVESIDAVPPAARLIFSAHGVSPEVVTAAQKKNLHVIDATCPLVSKVHREADRFTQEDIHVVLIGHVGHQELIGTAGHVKPQRLHIVETAEDIEKLTIPAHEKVGFITQTTLSVDDTRELILKLRSRYPRLTGPEKGSLCYATQNRQDAIKFMAPQVQLIIVVGSPNSSNSSRLKELAERLGVAAYMIDHPSQLQAEWLIGIKRIGLTAGASAPEALAQTIISRLKELGATTVQVLQGIEEHVTFPLPKGL